MMKSFCFTRNIATTSFFNAKPVNFQLRQVFPEDYQDFRKLDKWRQKELIENLKIRAKHEYPVDPDQRATWKHKRWYDKFLNVWVDTKPLPPKDFTVNYKNYRKFLFEAETPDEHFELLLDSYQKRKYIINSFDYASPISNISYYFQYLTNTKYIHGLPFFVEKARIDDIYLNNFRSVTEQILLIEQNNPNHQNELDSYKKSWKIASCSIKAIINYLVATLTEHNSILSCCEMDHNIHNCMFWFRGVGFLNSRLPDDHPVAFQIHDPVFMQIRTKEQLPEFSPRSGAFSTSGIIPSYYTTPHVFKLPLIKYRNAITPGYKLFAGDCMQNYQHAKNEELLNELPSPLYNQCIYGHTQILMLPETYSREWYKDNLEHSDITGEIEEHLKGKGIMSGWSWTAGLAHFQQYWMDKDIDRPFCSQSIVFDGQWLSFFCYQLNTVAIDADNTAENDKRNLCYGRTSVKLFDEVASDKVVGLNEEALTLLIKFIRNGLKQDNTAHIPSDEELEDYNSSLLIQEMDPLIPDIELQKPVHKKEMDRIFLLEQEAIKEEESKKNSFLKNLKNNFI